jgi:hypothetical protein
MDFEKMRPAMKIARIGWGGFSSGRLLIFKEKNFL